MSQNARGHSPDELPDSKRKGLALQKARIVKVVFLGVLFSLIAGAAYLVYNRLTVDNETGIYLPASANSQEIRNRLSQDDWQEFVYEPAAISFYYPKEAVAIEIDSGLAAYIDGERFLELSVARLNTQSLQELVQEELGDEVQTVRVNQRLGLSGTVGEYGYKYFPLYENKYIKFKFLSRGKQETETANRMIESLIFLSPDIVAEN